MPEERYAPGFKDITLVPKHKPLILVVEDEQDMRENLKELLSSKYTLLMARSGKEALKKYEANQTNINLVLLDIRLPDINGVEVLGKMKKIHLGPDIVMVTALKDLEIAIDSMQQGAYDYITKPFFAEDILRTIERAVEKENYLRKLKEIALQVEKEKICSQRRTILAQELKMKRKLEGQEFSLEEETSLKFFFPEEDYDFKALKRRLEMDLGQAAESPAGKRKNILIIEDEEDMRDNLKDLLKDSYAVSAAANGQEALAAMIGNKFDLMLLDIRLPDIYGIDLLKRIKALDPEVSVIMVTALKEVETAVSAMQGGAYDYVTKPFFQADLLATIERTLLNKDYKEIIHDLLQKLKETKLSHTVRLNMLKELINKRKSEDKKLTLGDVFCFFPEYAADDLYSEIELPDLPAEGALENFLERLKNRKSIKF